jgi:hypothetical protein
LWLVVEEVVAVMEEMEVGRKELMDLHTMLLQLVEHNTMEVLVVLIMVMVPVEVLAMVELRHMIIQVVEEEAVIMEVCNCFPIFFFFF